MSVEAEPVDPEAKLNEANEGNVADFEKNSIEALKEANLATKEGREKFNEAMKDVSDRYNEASIQSWAKFAKDAGICEGCSDVKIKETMEQISKNMEKVKGIDPEKNPEEYQEKLLDGVNKDTLEYKSINEYAEKQLKSIGDVHDALNDNTTWTKTKEGVMANVDVETEGAAANTERQLTMIDWLKDHWKAILGVAAVIGLGIEVLCWMSSEISGCYQYSGSSSQKINCTRGMPTSHGMGTAGNPYDYYGDPTDIGGKSLCSPCGGPSQCTCSPEGSDIRGLKAKTDADKIKKWCGSAASTYTGIPPCNDINIECGDNCPKACGDPSNPSLDPCSKDSTSLYYRHVAFSPGDVLANIGGAVTKVIHNELCKNQPAWMCNFWGKWGTYIIYGVIGIVVLIIIIWLIRFFMKKKLSEKAQEAVAAPAPVATPAPAPKAVTTKGPSVLQKVKKVLARKPKGAPVVPEVDTAAKFRFRYK